MGPIKIILNPIAGRGYGAKTEPGLRSLLEEEGVDFELVRTRGPAHASELAEQAVRDGFEVIVAAGGDGTTHEVVNGLMRAADGKEAGTLGVIPIGSGSDFANTVGVPADLRGACRRLAHGTVRVVDVGVVRLAGAPARYFDNTVNVGFGGRVTVEARKIKRLRGIALYLPAVLRTIFLHYQAPRLVIEYDDQELALSSLMVSVCNGSREGGGFFVAPDAEPDDGLFDLCIVGKVGRLGMLGLIPYFMRGTHIDREPVTMTRANRVRITSPDSLVAHVDGEILCTDGHEIEFEILPRALRVWC
jgi:YegS/Rv2252/BmrU family lipid kinase